MYRLPRSMRKMLRKPLGRVFRNTEALLEYLRKTKFSRLITVGDVCSKELVINGVIPDVVIIDGKTRRKKMPWKTKFTGRKFIAINKPSTISAGLVDAVSRSFGKRTLVCVKGEEDLAVLPAIKYCPYGSIVIYGLWFKGVVAVKAVKAMKNKINRFLERMRYED